MCAAMKFLIFSMLFRLLLAECNHTCACEDINTLHSGKPDIVYEKGVGCSQSLKCTSAHNIISMSKELSNIPDVIDGSIALFYNPSIPRNERPVLTVEYFSDFGLVCEDGRWFVTKFPMGIHNGLGPFGADAMNGKGYKATIQYLSCN
ncbi:hypothetical protein CAEBREN_17371 [Caenorhabditis brenneri]|uniref:Uncharacterized protein n=1 Tax=Caenorhabditis brenneri TaxID=135651 RepID=G0NNY4_CAEBE|nr:hypothetical protein CAEBREN_17371 [Caenorhabditis brenneri]